MNYFSLGYAIAILLFARTETITARVIDDFNDGVWNAGQQWDAENYLMGGLLPDQITFDENTSPGSLLMRALEQGDGQSTVIARKDVRLAPGEWVKVDVAIAAVEPRIPVHVGLGLIASRGHNPQMGSTARENSMGWALRSTGQVRGHIYGAGGQELADTARELNDYALGRFYTLAIRRVDQSSYEFYSAPTGRQLELCGEARKMTGSSGPTEQPPDIPGIFTDPGLGSYAVLLDDFEIGRDWPIKPGKARPNAPAMEVPRPDPDPHALELKLPKDINTLPRLKSSRHVVYMPKNEKDFTYHHSAELTWFKGKFYLAWTVTPKNELTLPYQAWLSTSPDGETWSPPVNIAAPGDAAYSATMREQFKIPAGETFTVNAAPRSWHIAGDKLYLWSLGWTSSSRGKDWVGRIFWTENGEQWHEIPSTELDQLEKEKGLTIRTTGSNRGFAQIRGGRLLASTVGSVRSSDSLRLCAPTTADPSGLTGWEGGWIDSSLAAEVGEPRCWEGPDGALHFQSRSTGTHIWHSYSLDSGRTWTQLRAQPGFPDNPANKNFGRLPDGSIWYVGDPVPLAQRIPLVLGISKDGWKFDRCFLVRWEPIQQRWPDLKKTDRPGYEYPTALYHDGYLYVAYSHARDYIEISKIKLSDLPE